MNLNYFLECSKINFLMRPIKKIFLKKPSQRHIGGFGELDGGGGYSGLFFLQRCKLNRKFYMDEN